jgi:hypothetical protein
MRSYGAMLGFDLEERTPKRLLRREETMNIAPMEVYYDSRKGS